MWGNVGYVGRCGICRVTWDATWDATWDNVGQCGICGARGAPWDELYGENVLYGGAANLSCLVFYYH